jgi:hypothetical protein
VPCHLFLFLISLSLSKEKKWNSLPFWVNRDSEGCSNKDDRYENYMSQFQGSGKLKSPKPIYEWKPKHLIVIIFGLLRMDFHIKRKWFAIEIGRSWLVIKRYHSNSFHDHRPLTQINLRIWLLCDSIVQYSTMTLHWLSIWNLCWRHVQKIWRSKRVYAVSRIKLCWTIAIHKRPCNRLHQQRALVSFAPVTSYSAWLTRERGEVSFWFEQPCALKKSRG